MSASVGEGTTAPQPRQDVEALVEQPGAALGVRLSFPKRVKPASSASPEPTPRNRRPPEGWSQETASLASFRGLRRGRGVTAVPGRTHPMLVAMAASASQGS